MTFTQDNIKNNEFQQKELSLRKSLFFKLMLAND